jgi:hypothetical protein
LAYLVVRQTRWFGFGEGGLAPDRPLSWPAVLPNIVESIRQTLGENFLVALHHQMREGAVTEKMAISLAAVLAAVLAAAALAGNSLRDFRHRIEGVALVASALVAGVLYTAQAPFPGVVPVVESLLRVTVLLPLATLVAARMQWISLDPRLAGLAAFAALWFLAAYAPTYSLHVAERHSYIPSFGLCLLLSIALWLPAACARNYLRRRLLEGVALGMSVFVGHGFYMAALGEAAWWVAANRWIGRLKSQMQEAYPSLPPDSRVVVLDVPELYQTVPLLPSWGVEGALKHWYDSSEVRADKSFIPRKDDFFAPHSRSRDHYQRLLLLRYKNEVLGRIDYLRFQDGARVRVGTAVAGSPPDPEAVLDVREGQLVR